MSSDSVQAVVLSEDTQLSCFVRRFLRQRGWNRHQIRCEPVPQGKGSGEQRVRERFLKELKAFRSRNHRAATCLIVATDADTQTVAERWRSLEEACVEAKEPFRGPEEKVIFVTPRRNIETWLAYLRGEEVDEATVFRKYSFESECHKDVERLDQMCRQQKLEPGPPPSLVTACSEFQRLAK